MALSATPIKRVRPRKPRAPVFPVEVTLTDDDIEIVRVSKPAEKPFRLFLIVDGHRWADPVAECRTLAEARTAEVAWKAGHATVHAANGAETVTTTDVAIVKAVYAGKGPKA